MSQVNTAVSQDFKVVASEQEDQESGSVGKESACNARDCLQGNTLYILAWAIPWMEESGGLQSIQLQESDNGATKPPPS